MELQAFNFPFQVVLFQGFKAVSKTIFGGLSIKVPCADSSTTSFFTNEEEKERIRKRKGKGKEKDRKRKGKGKEEERKRKGSGKENERKRKNPSKRNKSRKEKEPR